MMKTSRRPYTPRDIELAREIYRFLRRDLRAHEEPTFQTYTEVAQAVGTGNRNLGNALYYIQDQCHDRDWPTYAVFVVRKGRGLPARGCDVITREECETPHLCSPPQPLLSGRKEGLPGSLPFIPMRGRAREGESAGILVAPSRRRSTSV